MQRTILYFLFLFSTLNLSAQLTIIVDAIPANTPAGDPIYIAGDFQGWDPGSASEQLTEDSLHGRYYIDLSVSVDNIQFKFTRGTWPKVESDENGNFIPDRFYSLSTGDTLIVQILGWEDLDGSGSGESTAAENVQILTDSFYMPQVDRYRRIWVYLPPDYEDTDYAYPVLYMHDGQNVFDALTSFVGEWQVDETLNALHAEGDSGVIVVAIDNGGAARIDEYTPWSHPTYGGGEAAAYIDFIVENLKPYIDDNFRTLSDRTNTAIMGSSLGGLVSTYAGIEHQDVFSKVGSFSPSYWFSDNAFTHVSTTGKNANMRFYQLIGTPEGAVHVDNMYAMEDTMQAAGFGAAEILSVEKPDGQHSEWFWAREFEAAYLWLFRDVATSTNDLPNTNLRAVRLFPNPTEGQLSLRFYLGNPDYVHIDLIDSSGQQIRKIYGNALQRGNHQLWVNLSQDQLSPGTYFLQIRTEEWKITKQFVKL